jgi:hypothetical protein
LWTGLRQLDHVDNVADKIDLEGTLPQGGDVDPLDDPAQGFCGLGTAIRLVEGLV